MTKLGGEAVQAKAMGHNKGNLQKHIDGIINTQRKIETLKAEMANLYNKADDDGFDRKALKFMVKNKAKPMPIELKREINDMCSALGDQLVFDLPAGRSKAEETKASDKPAAKAADGKAA